jgi:Mannosylglycerate hydrolase MGH1-like glycoside hydrolase domain
VVGHTSNGVAYSFHCPDAAKFPAQFLWDSCWHAIALRHLDPAAARDELRTLLRAQEPDGFLPHTILWHRPVRLSRRFHYALQNRSDRTTRTIQPPFVAFAWELVAEASPDDPGFAREGLEALAALHGWLERERNPDGSGLVALISPDESGLDASPKFDALMGWRASGLPGFIWHIHELRKGGFQLDDVLRRGGFCVQEVLTTVAHAASLHSLARLSGDDAYRSSAERIEAALFERCWDEQRGLFFDLAYPSGEPQRVSTWASLAPLALPNLPREMATRLAEQLGDRGEYALPWPVPSTAASEPAFRRRTGPIPRYWRGETWLAGTWLLHRGLRQHGFHDLARTLARQGSRLVAGRGLREYYDPIEGTPQGAQHFGMSALVLDLERGS